MAVTAEDSLDLAKKHLARVLDAWSEPDWTDLSTFGFYCLEAAVVAGALRTGVTVDRTHWGKQRAARELAQKQGLDDISDLLSDLNAARKSTAYGDVAFPPLDAEDVARQIEEYVDSVSALFDED